MLACGMLVAAAACGSSSDGDYSAPDEDSSSETTRDSDDASLACNHFRNVMGDMADLQLNIEELSEKVREIKSNSIIGSEAMQRSSEQMVAAVNVGDLDMLVEASMQMSDACTAEGF